jgi:hypothetical protein
VSRTLSPLLTPTSARQRPRTRPLLPRSVITLIVAAAIAGAIFAFFGHAYLNYDSYYALVWGKQVAHGITPDYRVSLAPTPHPLAIAIGVPLSALGDSAEAVALAFVLLSIGLICVALYRLGAELYAWPVGLLAAVIAVTRVPPLNFGIRGYVDFPTIALILWGAVLESRRPRRGAPVMALLALAGLLRPEAWLFVAAYWLWVAPSLDWPGRLRLAAIGAAAPVLWGVSDLIVTGDALWSLHGTHEAAAALHRHRGLGAVPSTLPNHLGEILRLPELVAALAGFVAGLWWLRARSALPAALVILDGIAYLVFAIGGLSLITRYLFLAGLVLALFAAVAVFGWLALADAHPARVPWRALGLVPLIAIVALSPTQAHRLKSLRTDIRHRYSVQSDLHALVRSRAGGRAIARCPRLFVPNHGQIPLLAYWTGRRATRIDSAELVRPTRSGLYFSPATPAAAKLAVLDPRDPRRFSPPAPGAGPAGYRALARNRSWVLFAAGCA